MKLPPVAEVVRLRTSRDKPTKSHDFGYERYPGCGHEDFGCGRSPDRATSFRPRVSPQTRRPSINPPQRMARSADRPHQPIRNRDLVKHRPPPLAVRRSRCWNRRECIREIQCGTTLRVVNCDAERRTTMKATP